MKPTAVPVARPQAGSRQAPRTSGHVQPAPPPRLFGVTGRQVLLLVLAGLWTLLLLSPWSSHQPPAVPGAGSRAARAPLRPEGALPRLPRLKRELIDLPQKPYTPPVTNPFGEPPPPPPARPVVVVRPVPPPPPAPRPAPPPAPPPDPFQEAAKQLRFVGFIQAGDRMIAMISQGKEVHTVGPGDTVGGRFRVASVTEESVLLASPEGDKQVRLTLQGGTSSGGSAGR
jgi:hypothetical protein